MKVAIYLRISSEDGDLKDSGKAESESISNQRGLLLNFISNHSEFSGWEVSEFCDDGWSGKNFERPDFLRMMEQIKQGQIDCVLVKDLSRFGRDYLVVGNYISRVFPFLGVRFIAVNIFIRMALMRSSICFAAPFSSLMNTWISMEGLRS